MKQPNLFKDTELEIKFAERPFSWVAIDGQHGDGKTLLMTKMAYKYRKNYDLIVANYHLKIKNFEYVSQFTGEYIMNLNKRDLGKKLVLFDEAQHDFDSRQPVFEKRTRKLKDSLFQIRKVDFDLIANIRDLSYLDFRFVRNATKFFHAQGRLEGTSIFVYQQVALLMGGIGFDVNTVIPLSRFPEDMEHIYDIYDTYEIIENMPMQPQRIL